jgi:hypothetical protein
MLILSAALSRGVYKSVSFLSSFDYKGILKNEDRAAKVF